MRPIDADALLEKKTVPLGLRCEVVAVSDINNAPTINPESLRPKGEWAMTNEGEWLCTNCKEEVAICDCGKDRTYRKPYCPNCGADMRGTPKGD